MAEKRTLKTTAETGGGPDTRPAERVPGTPEHLGSDRPYEGGTDEAAAPKATTSSSSSSKASSSGSNS